MHELLHVDLDGFFVAVERLHAPELRDRPVIIGGQPTAWGRVVAVSREAARRGVKPGLGLGAAAVKCPDAVFLDGSVERYLEASAAVDEILREPLVPVEWTSIDSVFLDLSGSAGRVGPSRRVAERLQARILGELGFDVACGLAGTRTAAQIASRMSRPRGLLYVLPGYEARLLAALDVGLLPDLPPGARQRLLERGVTTLGQLGALDGEACRALLGQSGPLYAERARGLDGRAVDGSQPPRSLAREVTLAEPTRDEGRLLSVLQHVCDTLSARLRQMGWFAHTVALRLSLDEPERLAAPFGATTRSLTLREATAQPDALMSAARALFRAHWRHRAVVRLGLTVTNLQSVGPQIPLFPVAERVSAAGLRTRPGFRALVEGRYLEPHRGRRRVG